MINGNDIMRREHNDALCISKSFTGERERYAHPSMARIMTASLCFPRVYQEFSQGVSVFHMSKKINRVF
jgi:hypothetical protein